MQKRSSLLLACVTLSACFYSTAINKDKKNFQKFIMACWQGDIQNVQKFFNELRDPWGLNAFINVPLKKLGKSFQKLLERSPWVEEFFPWSEQGIPLNALSAALLGHHGEVVNFLLKQKTLQINAQDKNLKLAPLHYAAIFGKFLPMLLEVPGIDSNIQDALGNTPLHYAVMADFGVNVNILLSKGAQGDIQNNKGETPLDLAIKKGNVSDIEALRKKKSDLQRAVQNLAESLNELSKQLQKE